MDCVWWYMILSMVVKAATGHLYKDMRSEDESDEDPAERRKRIELAQNVKKMEETNEMTPNGDDESGINNNSRKRKSN